MGFAFVAGRKGVEQFVAAGWAVGQKSESVAGGLLGGLYRPAGWLANIFTVTRNKGI